MRWWSWRWNVSLSEVQTTKISSASMVTEAFWSANKSAREGKKCKISATDDVTNDSCRKFWNRRCKLIPEFRFSEPRNVFGSRCDRFCRRNNWIRNGPEKGKTATPLFSRRTNFGTHYRNKIRLEIKPTLKLRARVRRKVRVRVFFFSKCNERLHQSASCVRYNNWLFPHPCWHPCYKTFSISMITMGVISFQPPSFTPLKEKEKRPVTTVNTE